jgi:uncharacterized RDD family membrane protein YckC
LSEGAVTPQGWYRAEGDPVGTQRFWDGHKWQGGPRLARHLTADAQGAPAEVIERILARFVDLIVWLVISVTVHAALGEPLIYGGSGAKWWIAGLISLVIIATYEVVLPVILGATIGKIAMGLGVVSDDGSAVAQESALIRVAPALLAAVPVYGLYLAVLVAFVSIPLMISDRRTQAIWDKLAHTVVVKS